MNLKSALAAVCLLVLGSCKKFIDVSVTHNNSSESSKPNIILLLMDDVGYEIPNYTGGQSYSTPNLNMIAAQGKQYIYCHSLPLCSPSRVELLTGLYNFRNYLHWGILDTSNTTIANVLSNSGYATCVAGKWQLDGGDAAIHKLGFQKYCVWQPFAVDDEQENNPELGSHYKDPKVYQDNGYLPESYTNGKYGEDIFRKYMFDFIDSSTKPFFVYWATNLCHRPFTPTPDDADFKTWSGTSDTKYFPSMVKYLDKEIGMLKDKIDSMPNTILIIIGDNGTDGEITSVWQNKNIKGGKNIPNEAGTRVPMLVYGATVTAGTDSALIDFTDFFPVISGWAGATHPFTDGVDFNTSQRQWIFQHFQLKGLDNPRFRVNRWAQNKTYKLYDTSRAIPTQQRTGNFYRMFNTTLGKNDSLITPRQQFELNIDTMLRNVLSQMH